MHICSYKIIAILILTNVLLWAFPFSKFIQKFEPTGDEPHYLIITQSLIQDQDLDLKNNYVNEDYKAYYNRVPLDANPKITPYDKWYPICNLGLSFLAIPAYWGLGRLGVSLLSGLLSILTLLNIYLLVLEMSEKRKLALSIWALFVFTFPMLFYHFQILTEIPAALLLIYAIRKIRQQNNGSYWILGLISLSFPWIHIKYGLLVICLGLVSLIVYRNIKQGLVLFGALFLNIMIYPLYYIRYFNDPFFIFKIHDNFLNPLSKWQGLIGTLMDQEFGLFFYCPIFLICFSGLILGWRTSLKKDILIFILTFGIYWFATGCYKAWDAGWSFPARYLVPITPMLAIPLCACFNQIKTLRQKIITTSLVLLSLFISIKLLEQPWNLYNDGDGSSNFLINLGLDSWIQYFPSLVPSNSQEYWTVVAWILGVIGLNIIYSWKKA